MPLVVVPSAAATTTAWAAADSTNGWVSVYWTNPVGSTATYNRIYYRRSGTGSWYLLVDNVPPAIGSQQSLVVADQIALNTSYDFAISAVNDSISESSLTWSAAGTVSVGTGFIVGTGIVSNTSSGGSASSGPGTLGVAITTTGGGYTAILHVQGQAQAYSAPLMLTGGPSVKETLDAQQALMWGLAQPAIRYGTGDFRDITLKAKIVDLPGDPQGANAYAKLAAVLAKLKTGATGVLRAADGSLMTVGLKAAHDVAFLPQIYLAQREVTLNFVQVPNQYQPSTTRGSAAGFLQQVSGTVSPLNPVEQGI